MTTGSVNSILAELRSRGVRIWAAGSKPRFEPRSAVDDELLTAMKARKGDLLASLGSGHPKPGPSRHSARDGTQRVSRDGHEVYLPDGWTPASWARCLRQRAEACTELAPVIAKRYLDWAAILEDEARRN
jgi:hypothetical protein